MSARLIACLLLFVFSACQPTGLSQNKTSAKVPFSMDELQRRSFLYFWELPEKADANWQVPDRWPTLNFSSIAATGFGLTAYFIGIERGYITREQGADRVLKTLEVLINLPQGDAMSGVSGHKGFFYHFLNHNDARRYKNVELSTIDTGLLMAGVLSVMSYFDGSTEAERKIREISDKLFRRVEWDWALNDKGYLSMGWFPDKGFLKSEWHGYNEAMILLIMAMGSPSHPIPANSWEKWCEPYFWNSYYDQEYINFAPLFGHQYSHMYVDFQGIYDPYMKAKGIDYFENARRATYANRAYCMENPSGFKGYGKNTWGLTACDGPGDFEKEWKKGHKTKFVGYGARGASGDYVLDDGTIAPTAAGGSMPFAPEICMPALKHIWEKYYDGLVDQYGFRDAFNPSLGWYDVDYLGIDQGPILIQMENHRTRLVWEVMKKNSYIRDGLKKAGFKGGWLEKNS
ncbi:MAG: glucoamylase family protein [Saprospiraceae bacterium]|nr:glucoamylase family protein [Saprospiraceae bacterium]MDZ4702487.1 glucoamylase family protein [Saprospiraceae bacterium]